MISEKSSTLGSAVGWVKRHRRATHQGTLGKLDLNWICAPLLFAKGDIQRSLGQRPRNAEKSEPISWLPSSLNYDP